MTLLDNIVEVKISKSSFGLIPVSFNTLLILGDTEKKIRFKKYSNLTEVVIDYATESAEFRAAKLAFGQSTKLDKLYIGQVFENESFESAYLSISEKHPDFYAVVITSKREEDQIAVSNLIETQKRIFGISTKDTNALDEHNDTNILHRLNALGLKRTFVIFSSDDTYPEAAWFGLMLTKSIGTSTWSFKVLSGFEADILDTSKINAIEAKNGNHFGRIAGRNAMFNGKMVNGEYIDIIVSLDWLTADIQNRVGSALISAEKVPFTNHGIVIVEQAIFCGLTEAAKQKIIDEESIKISVPKIGNVSEINRANRILTNVKFEARLSGAIHQLIIQGTVTN